MVDCHTPLSREVRKGKDTTPRRAVPNTRHPARAHARHRPQRSAARPNSAPCKKRILCDRHHIASAMAELVSYLSIVPHMRSSDVPPKHSSPPNAGHFFRRSTPASRAAAEPIANPGQSLPPRPNWRREPSPASRICFAREERREVLRECFVREERREASTKKN
jgi:hypothetical protein